MEQVGRTVRRIEVSNMSCCKWRSVMNVYIISKFNYSVAICMVVCYKAFFFFQLNTVVEGVISLHLGMRRRECGQREKLNGNARDWQERGL